MVSQFIRETVFIFNESAIYILFGFFIAGLLKIYLPTEKIYHYLGEKTVRSVIWASLIGIPLPLCSCAVLPTAMSLRKQGASKGATLSFLISTPETGVDSISVTYALIDPIMTLFRPVSALITASTAGIAINFSDKKKTDEVKTEIDDQNKICESECCEHGLSESYPQGKLREFFHYAFVELLNDITFWLILGIVIAGLIAAIVPDFFFENYVGSGIGSLFMMLLVGVPIYMCAASSTPIAAALILKGLNPGAALVFLLAGPATNVGTTLAVGKFLGKQAMVIYLGTISIMSIMLGLLLNSVYASLDIKPMAIIGQASELLPFSIKVTGSIILSLLILRNLLKTGLGNAIHSLNEKLYEFTGFKIGK